MEINVTNFPDENFRKYVEENCNTDGKEGLSQSEIDAVNRIYVSEGNIADLKGVEYFSSLTYLYCNSNQLTNLDVSQNTALTELYCDSNQLTSLDVSKNTALTKFDCGSNQLTSLDLRANTALTNIYTSYNKYPIGAVGVSFPLSSFPAGFDSSKASGWTGAEYDSASDALINFTSRSVSYDYDCGNGRTMNVTLSLDSYKSPGDVEINEINFPDDNFRKYVEY